MSLPSLPLGEALCEWSDAVLQYGIASPVTWGVYRRHKHLPEFPALAMESLYQHAQGGTVKPVLEEEYEEMALFKWFTGGILIGVVATLTIAQLIR